MKPQILAGFLYVQARIRKFAVKAACGPRGGQGENLPCPIMHTGVQRKMSASADGRPSGAFICSTWPMRRRGGGDGWK